MQRRNISKEIFNKVVKSLPEEIVKMLPESPENLLPYATRINEVQFSPNIKDDVKELMVKHLLNDEEYLKTFYYVMAITFYNKKCVENPKMAIVVAQTGSGKSNLTAKLLREDENYIFIDSDKYKHFRYDAKKIAQEYPVLYPNLTGPDCYDHAENIYRYAIENKYNIIKETAPSKNKQLIEINEEYLQKRNYKVSLHVLAVSKLNSMLSVHERYELQIMHGLKTAKLTPISRHNESYDALINKISELENGKYKNDIYIYIRGSKKDNYNPVLIYPSEKYDKAIDAIKDARIIDEKQTKKEFDNRYNYLIEQMNNRKAPKEQIDQLKQIKLEEKDNGDK